MALMIDNGKCDGPRELRTAKDILKHRACLWVGVDPKIKGIISTGGGFLTNIILLHTTLNGGYY